MDQIDKTWWIGASDQIVAAVPSDVLRAIMTSNLAKAVTNSSFVQETRRKYEDRSVMHPQIYIRQLTIGADHEDLTIAQPESLARAVERYTRQTSESNTESCYIDKALCPGKWLREWSDSGLRAQLNTGDCVNNSALENMYRTFSNRVTQLVEHAHKKKDTHILPVYCVGYADNVAGRENRLTEWSLHNTLIIFTFQLFKLQGVDVRIHTIPICLLTRQEIAPVAEKLLGHITRAR
ncbi:hypothetical protein E8E11_002068 [Didymella keratinophila]|nr:hypothetical protein E8E11_002068 [Didymella keratinophila]